MFLSEHFTLREMTKSYTAVRLGIQNKPSPQQIENLKRLCDNVLEPVRKHFGIAFTPSSAFRSKGLNVAVGGAPASQHVAGEAADIEIPMVDNLDLALWISENVDFDQLILESYTASDPTSGWVHVSHRADDNRGDVLSFNSGVYSDGLPVTMFSHATQVADSGLLFTISNILRDMLSLWRKKK